MDGEMRWVSAEQGVPAEWIQMQLFDLTVNRTKRAYIDHMRHMGVGQLVHLSMEEK